jgi:hypothetical protein
MTHDDDRDFPRALRRLKWWGASIVGLVVGAVLLVSIEIFLALLKTYYFGLPTAPYFETTSILMPMAIIGFTLAWMSERWWMSFVYAAEVLFLWPLCGPVFHIVASGFAKQIIEFHWILIKSLVLAFPGGPASIAASIAAWWLYFSLIYLFGWCLAWILTPSNWWPKRQHGAAMPLK